MKKFTIAIFTLWAIALLCYVVFSDAPKTDTFDFLRLDPQASVGDCNPSARGTMYADSAGVFYGCDGVDWSEFSTPVLMQETVAAGNYTVSTPTKANALYEMTYSSSGGSFVFSEVNARNGARAVVCNEGSNTFSIADTAGLSEVTGGGLTVGQFDCYNFVYVSDRWAQHGGSNN